MLQPNPLNSLNTMELLSKIEEFKRLDLKTASINDITMKVCQTLSCMIVTSSVFKEGTRLYRVRSLTRQIHAQGDGSLVLCARTTETQENRPLVLEYD